MLSAVSVTYPYYMFDRAYFCSQRRDTGEEPSPRLCSLVRITERAIAPVERLFTALVATSIVCKLRPCFLGIGTFDWNSLSLIYG